MVRETAAHGALSGYFSPEALQIRGHTLQLTPPQTVYKGATLISFFNLECLLTGRLQRGFIGKIHISLRKNGPSRITE